MRRDPKRPSLVLSEAEQAGTHASEALLGDAKTSPLASSFPLVNWWDGSAREGDGAQPGCPVAL